MNDSWWTLLALAGGNIAVLIVTLFYCLRHWRSARLGDRWIEAAGSYETALLELENYTASLDVMLSHGMKRIRR